MLRPILAYCSTNGDKIGDPASKTLKQSEENVVMSRREERRSEARTKVDEYYSVEFSVPDAEFIYQFRIWNLSSQGICVVVKEDSDLLKHLRVGDVLNLKYHPADLTDPAVQLRTEIKHITKQEEGRFKGHALVGLFILEKETSDETESPTDDDKG